MALPPVFGKELKMQQQLVDNFNRKFEYLRLSITDVCNFKCNYCLLQMAISAPIKSSFSAQREIKNLVCAFAEAGH